MRVAAVLQQESGFFGLIKVEKVLGKVPLSSTVNDPILDEAGEVVFAMLASLPANVVDVQVERKRPCRLELKAKKFLP